MTTLEVVEAVQRSLENEGFLQSIRAQLRANVLRIISSGPDYSPSTGKAVELARTRTGIISLNLVKGLLEDLNMSETLTVFEAESGCQQLFSASESQKMQSDLHIVDNDDNYSCVLEKLVASALQQQPVTAAKNNDSLLSDKFPTVAESKLDDVSEATSPDREGEGRFSASHGNRDNKDDDSFVKEIEDIEQRQKEDEVQSSHAESPTRHYESEQKVESKENSPAKPIEKDVMPQVDSPFSTSASVAAAGRDGMRGSALDVSSSFEAENSPPRPASLQPPRSTTSSKEEEEEEDDFEIEEEIEEEEEVPEYDSDDDKEKGPETPTISPNVLQNASSAADTSIHPTVQTSSAPSPPQRTPEGKEEEEEKEGEGQEEKQEDDGKEERLRVAGADDFGQVYDRLDRQAASFSDGDADRNRVSVRSTIPPTTHQEQEQEQEEGRGAVPGPGASTTGTGRANVVRLSQGATISRARGGWRTNPGASNNNNNDDDDFSADDEDADVHDVVVASEAKSRDNSLSMQMDDFEDEREDNRDGRKLPGIVSKRSNNQDEEEEEEEANASSPESRGGAGPVRGAFGSPSHDQSNNSFESAEDEDQQEAEAEAEAEAAEEYEDDDEFEDDDFEDEDDGSAKKPVSTTAASTGGGFTMENASPTPPPAAAGKQDAHKNGDLEEEEEEILSVEEEENISIGSYNSDDVGDFELNDSVNRKSQPGADKSSGGMFRARSGALPDLPNAKPHSSSGSSSMNTRTAPSANRTNFDSILNSFGDDDSDEEGEGDGDAAAGAGGAGTTNTAAGAGKHSSTSQITARMKDIDARLEEMDSEDASGELAQLRKQAMGKEDTSVASENIEDMEFSTGGDIDEANSSDSSGDGSFSFLDSSTK